MADLSVFLTGIERLVLYKESHCTAYNASFPRITSASGLNLKAEYQTNFVFATNCIQYSLLKNRLSGLFPATFLLYHDYSYLPTGAAGAGAFVAAAGAAVPPAAGAAAPSLRWPLCILNVLVGANSPSLWPTIFSVT